MTSLLRKATKPPMQGTWRLTAPDGRTWNAESPLQVVAKESRERIPPELAMQRIMGIVNEPDPLWDAINKIARTPAMPLPDPNAHSRDAYFEAVCRAYFDIQRIAREAIEEALK